MQMSQRQLIALLCAAEVAGMLAYAGFFAQVPVLSAQWRLTATEAGWISGAFYAGYMVAVPMLVTLTDHRDPRQIYLLSMLASAVGAFGFGMIASGPVGAAVCHAVMGVGLAGTYMPGLRLLTDRLDGVSRSRAVAVYTGCYAVGTACSFLMMGQMSRHLGWRPAFAFGAVGPLLAVAGVGAVYPARARESRSGKISLGLLDFRPVFQDPAVMARAIAYAAHNFELFGLWSWAVAFLTFAYRQRPGDAMPVGEATVAAALALMLLPASIAGNEIAVRIGSRRWIVGVMIVSAALASILGFLAGSVPTGVVVALCVIHGITAAAESGALTSSVVAVSDPRYRGMTMAAYSMVGFAGSCLGPLVFGFVLESVGPDGVAGWGTAFAALGAGALLGPAAFALFDRRRPLLNHKDTKDTKATA